jgi:hypothetical protein
MIFAVLPCSMLFVAKLLYIFVFRYWNLFRLEWSVPDLEFRFQGKSKFSRVMAKTYLFICSVECYHPMTVRKQFEPHAPSAQLVTVAWELEDCQGICLFSYTRQITSYFMLYRGTKWNIKPWWNVWLTCLIPILCVENWRILRLGLVGIASHKLSSWKVCNLHKIV